MEAELTAMSGLPLLGLRLWMALANSSFPVPLSPRSRNRGVGGGDLLQFLRRLDDLPAAADDDRFLHFRSQHLLSERCFP